MSSQGKQANVERTIPGAAPSNRSVHLTVLLLPAQPPVLDDEVESHGDAHHLTLM